MSLFLMLNDIQTTNGTFSAGELLDDQIINVTQLETAGAVVIPFEDEMETLRERFVTLRNTNPTTNSSVLHDSLNVAPFMLPGAGLDPANYTIVEDIGDFPDPVGNIITLTTGVFWINGSVDMGDTTIVVAKDSFLLGIVLSDQLVWTGGAGPHVLFEGSDGDEQHSVRNLEFVGAAGEDMFGITGGTPLDLSFIEMCVSNSSFGLLACTDVFLIRESEITGDLNGLRLSGTGNVVSIRQNLMSQAVGATSDVLDFGASVWNFILVETTAFVTVAGNSAINAAASNANLTPSTGRGEIEECRFLGAGSQIDGGITVNDLQWIFSENTGLAGSVAVGGLELVGNTTTTIANGTFEVVLGTFSAFFARRFAASAAGVVTYLGLNPRLYQFNSAFKAAMASGSSKSISFQLFHTPLSTGTPVAVGNPLTVDVINQGVDVSLLTGVELVTGDELQLQLRNNTDGIGVTVTDLEALVTAVPTGL